MNKTVCSVILLIIVGVTTPNQNYFVRQAVGTAAEHVIGTCNTNPDRGPEGAKICGVSAVQPECGNFGNSLDLTSEFIDNKAIGLVVSDD